MDWNARIFVAGHRGMVGSAVTRLLQKKGAGQLLLPARAELDLLDQAAVARFYAGQRPDYVIVAAAKVGGIRANDEFPAEFIYENLQIESNLIHGAWKAGVKKLIFLGSSCIYPKMAPQPIREEALLTSPLEPTNEWYAIAKIAGIKLCQAYRRQYGADFISLMPTNLYGPNDNYDLETSHVLPALIHRFHRARNEGAASVVCWGTGKPRREFLHADDLASAIAFALEHYSGEMFLNVGFGEDVTIQELAQLVADVVGFRGQIQWDASKPDGTPRKLLDSSRLRNLGWKPVIPLREGIERTYQDFLARHSKTPVTRSAAVPAAGSGGVPPA